MPVTFNVDFAQQNILALLAKEQKLSVEETAQRIFTEALNQLSPGIKRAMILEQLNSAWEDNGLTADEEIAQIYSARHNTSSFSL